MSVEIFCPLYNAEKYLPKLVESISKQKDVKDFGLHFLLTESEDNTEKYLQQNNLNYDLIKKEDFSHSLTREKYALKSKADIIVFISQDIIIKKDNWLKNLVTPIEKGEVEATFSRQICRDKSSIEFYTRQKNYPKKSRIVSKNDIEKLGLNTFFFSDAASAIKTSIFKKLKGYDGKNLPISEDMYFAYKLIQNGYKIKYCANSEIVHSHNFSFKEQYDRYKLTGQFFKENSYLDNYGTTKSGSDMAKYVLRRALQEKNFRVLLKFPSNMAARFLGMKAGKNIVSATRLPNPNKKNQNFKSLLIGLFSFLLSMFLYYAKLNIIAAILLLATGVFLCINERKAQKYLTNTKNVFFITWFTSISLSLLRLHQNQTEWKINTWICIIAAFVFFNIGYIIYEAKKRKNISKNTQKKINILNSKKINLIFILVISLLSLGAFIYEISIEQTLPIISKNMSSYQEFGVGKMHFITVSCTIVPSLSCAYYLNYKKNIHNKERLLLIIINLIALSIPILLVSRFFIVLALILASFSIMENNKNKELLAISIALILAIIGWGVISNFRNQDDAYLKEALQIQDDAILPIKSMQLYMYIAMNYDNFNQNVDNVSKYSYGAKSFLPIIELFGLDNSIPGATNAEESSYKIIPTYNTFPIIMEPYLDLGLIGIIFYMFIIGFISAFTENLSIEKSTIAITIKSLIKYSLFISFFVSYFSNKTFVFFICLLIFGMFSVNHIIKLEERRV